MATKTGTHVNFVKVPTTANFDDITTKADGTIYFIVDAKKIYLDGVMYGFNSSDVANQFVKLGGDTMTGELTVTDGGNNTSSYIKIGDSRIDFGNAGGEMTIQHTMYGLQMYVGDTSYTFDKEVLSLRKGQGDEPIRITGVADPTSAEDAVNKGYLDTNVINKIGKKNGIATLDNTGVIPSGQLPSYVDDIVEYSNKKSFPASGEAEKGKLYIDLSNNRVYRWGGSAYVNVSDGNAHLTLGTTSSTAYRGDHGKDAYDHISKTDNPHGVTKEQIYLGRVEDYEIATKKEAQDGETNTAYMTPLRTKEAIEKLGPKLSWTVVA